MNYYLAIDIGATSGRHILAYRNEAGTLEIEEIYRFTTPLVKDGPTSCYWDIDVLFQDVLNGLKKAKELGKIPSRIGIDTFGVDYALLDEKDCLLGHIRSYRDERTNAMKKTFLTPERIYQLTGIQPHAFDTVYQLADDWRRGKLFKAKAAMMLPSYLAYLLTGIKQNELSILSTSALMDSRTFTFRKEILEALGLKESFFPNPIEAGNLIGPFSKKIQETIGYQADVYAALEHDTASAFYGSEALEGEALLSSGTWSLLGAILPQPIITKESFEAGLSNEFSHRHEVRFLRNIAGMWLINTLMRQDPDRPDILSVVEKAKKGSDYPGRFDPEDERLMNPIDMKETIKTLLLEGNYPEPKDFGEYYYAIYLSLAYAYSDAIERLEKMTEKKFHAIRVFGGGSKNLFLNELTSKITNLPVYVGPSEATAMGNILSIEEGE